MNWTEIFQISGIVFLVLATMYTIIAMSFFVGNKDSLADIQKSMATIVGTSLPMVMLTGIFTYIYVRVHPQALVSILLLIAFVSLEVSLAAVGATVLAKGS
jgi:hypothetical protein